MTGFRAARINAGYATAREAHAAFAKGKKGREALSFSYWQRLEATGPKHMNISLQKRLAQFLGQSANLVFAWTAEPTTTTTTKGKISPTATRHSTGGANLRAEAFAEARPRQKRKPEGNPSGFRKATTTTMILSRKGCSFGATPEGGSL